ALAIGRGGVSQVSQATGLARGIVQAGVNELQATQQGPTLDRLSAGPLAGTGEDQRFSPRLYPRPRDRVRLPGGGRKLTEVKDPAILATLEQLVENDVAGDPMGEARWVRVTPKRLSEQLAERGHRASDATVRRLLVKLGFAMRGNRRRQVNSKCPERD